MLLLPFLAVILLAQAPGAEPVRSLLDKAHQALKAHDLEAAVAAFRQAVERAPGRIEIHKDLAEAYIKMGEMEKAVQELETVRRLAPGDYENALSLAFLYYETEHEDQALELFERAAKSPDPGTRGTAQENLARIRRDLQVQIRRWRRVVELEPENRTSRQELASFYRRNRDYRQAIEQYLALRRAVPGDQASLPEVAWLLELAGEPAEARAYSLLAWRSPDPRISELGRARLNNRIPAPADFRRALELDPKNLRVRRELAGLYRNAGQPEAAVSELEKIVAQEPEDWETVTELALLYVDAGRGDRARPLLERVVKSSHPDLAHKAAEALRRLRP